MKTNLALLKSGGRAGHWALCWEVGVGVNLRACSRQLKSSEFLIVGRSRLLIKSPGTVSSWPYTSSADEQPRSSLGAILIPESTHKRSLVQLGPGRPACKADFMLVKALDQAVVWWSRVPKNCTMEDHSCKVNCVSLLIDMCNGTPNREIHCNTNAWAQVLAVASLSGMAFSQ